MDTFGRSARTTNFTRGLAALVLLTAVLAACGGGGGSTKAAAASSSDATLKIRDQAAELRANATAAFAAANDGQGLSIGQTVKTNGTGFAQVNYRDGSLTRLDANAQFTLTDLTTAGQAQLVVGTLDGGRAWSNVQKATSSDGRYEIDTSVATASVRGTKFNTDCTNPDKSCTFTVAEGTVTVTPKNGTAVDLTAGQSLTVHPDTTTTTNPTQTPDQLTQDPWIAKNTTIDTNEPLNGSPSSSASSPPASGTSAPAGCVTLAGEATGANRHPELYISNQPPSIGDLRDPNAACVAIKAGPVDICDNQIGHAAIEDQYIFDGVTTPLGTADSVGCATVNLTPGAHTLASPQLPGIVTTVFGT